MSPRTCIVAVTCAWFASCATVATSPAAAPRPRGAEVENITLQLGQRSLDDQQAWTPGEDQGMIGVTYDIYWMQNEVLGLGIEVSGLFSYNSTRVSSGSSSFDFNTGTAEIATGLRATLEAGDTGLRFYVGAGPAVIDAFAEGEVGNGSVSDDEASLGFYVHGGVYWVLAQHFEIGFDYRALRGTSVQIFGVETDANYEQGSLTLGYSF